MAAKHSLPPIEPGQVFHRWTVLRPAPKRPPRATKRWFCRCVCSTERDIGEDTIRAGRSKSCGCLKAELTGNRFRRHGMIKTAEYKTWRHILARTTDPSHASFKNYGAKGIRVCGRWLGVDGFKNFFTDMGKRPGPTFSIERKEATLGYEPDNCCWATRIEQNNNTKRNRRLTVEGETLTIAQWARRTGQKHATIWSRSVRYGWNDKDSVLG